ncbi:MAG: hypothetical protein LUD46_13100 [Parabacteroides sp.]|nr:hypothetical protein [Parabacteroides sp.]
MKKIVLMVAVVACVAFASQNAQALTVNTSVENVAQDEYTKVELEDVPQAVKDAVAKDYEGSSIKEAFVAGADAAKKYKVVIVTEDQMEQTLLYNEKGEAIV